MCFVCDKPTTEALVWYVPTQTRTTQAVSGTICIQYSLRVVVG